MFKLKDLRNNQGDSLLSGSEQTNATGDSPNAIQRKSQEVITEDRQAFSGGIFNVIARAMIEEALDEGKTIAEFDPDMFEIIGDFGSDCNIAGELYYKFEQAEKQDELRQWSLNQLTRLVGEGPNQVVDIRSEKPRIKQIYVLLNLVKEFLDQWNESEREQIIKILETIWTNHLEWRRYAGQVALDSGMNNWLDPATAAAESLLSFKSIEPEMVLRQMSEVDELYRPVEALNPMRDFNNLMMLAKMAALCQVSQNVDDIQENPWPESTAKAFAKMVSEWINRNPMYFEYVCCALYTQAGPSGWPGLKEQIYIHAQSELSEVELAYLTEVMSGFSEFPVQEEG